jgi:hypothetical protein
MPLLADPQVGAWYPLNWPFFLAGIGPLNGSLDNRMEVTFGYNPLELARYTQYLEAATANPKLLNGVAVTYL